MNPANLSANEVLRMCNPSTDLEKRLFDLVSELDDEIESLNSQQSQEDCDCDECEDFCDELDEIRSAIDLIEQGRVDDAVKKLKALV